MKSFQWQTTEHRIVRTYTTSLDLLELDETISMADNRTSNCTDMYNLSGFLLQYLIIPICLVVICQNVLSLATIRRSPKLHTNTNLFIASVAVAGILMSLSNMICAITHTPGINISLGDSYLVDSFILGNSLSIIFLSFSQLGIISIDRYIYIAYPFYYMKHVTKRLVVTIIACLWCVALVYGFIPLILYRDASYHNECIFVNSPIEYFLPVIILSCLNVIIVIIFNFKIAVLAFRRKKTMNARKLRTDHLENVTMFVKNRTSAFKSAKFFSAMCGVYCLCIVPSGILYVLTYGTTIPLYMNTLVTPLLVVHS
jgi:hypothetical protein